MRKSLVAALLCAAVSAAAFGDQVDLKDGQTLYGTITRAGDAVTIKTNDGQTIKTRDSDILRIVTPTTLDREAEGEWANVSRSLKDAADIQTAITLLEKFVDTYGATLSGHDAAAALAHYKEVAAAGAVKFQGKWMTTADKDAVTKAWRGAAQGAVDAYQAANWRDAVNAAKAALDKDKGNAAALTIAGLASYKLTNTGPAIMYFTTLANADNSSPLAENNLAILALDQKHYGEALAHFYKAMEINPDHRTLVDNVSVALTAYADNRGDKTAATYVSLKKLFDAAEKRMESTMASRGMVRSGSGWMSQQDADKNKTTVANLQKKLKTLETRYEKAQAQIASLESQVTATKATYDNDNQMMQQIDVELMARRPGTDVAGLMRTRQQTNQDASRAQSQGQQFLSQRQQALADVKDLLTQRDALTAQINSLTTPAPITAMIEFGHEDGVSDLQAPPATAPARGTNAAPAP